MQVGLKLYPAALDVDRWTEEILDPVHIPAVPTDMRVGAGQVLGFSDDSWKEVNSTFHTSSVSFLQITPAIKDGVQETRSKQ